MLFDRHFRREEEPWEVVDIREVAPIPVWDEEEDMNVVRIHSTNLTFKFVHDLKGADDVRKAVQYARARLIQDAMRLKYNVLLSEGWRCTLLRQGRRHRVEVVYSGRPARALGKLTHHSQPPFIGVLDHCEYQVNHHLAPPRPKLFRRWSLTSSRRVSRVSSCVSSC